MSSSAESVIDAPTPAAVEAEDQEALEVVRARLARMELAFSRLADDLRELRILCGGDVPARAPDGEEILRLYDLSAREMEVLRLLLEGRRVSSISRALEVSPHTTRNHLKSIFRKVGVHSQDELIDRLKPRPPVM